MSNTYFSDPNSDINRYTADLNSGWAQDAGKYYRDTQKQDSFQPSKGSDYVNKEDGWSKFAKGLRMAGDVWNNRDGGYGGYGGGYDRPISSVGGGGIQQSGDLTFVYPQQFSPFTIAGTPGSSGGGFFGKAGGLAGALGSAFGIFGPLGAPIGAAVGGLIDSARG